MIFPEGDSDAARLLYTPNEEVSHQEKLGRESGSQSDCREVTGFVD